MADFSILKEQIAAALPESTEGEITATIMVAQFWAAIDAINTAKADQGDLDALAGVVAGKQDALTLAAPLAFSSNGALILNYSGHGITLEADGYLGIEAGGGLGFVDSTLVVDYGDGLTTEDDTSTLIARLGDGLTFDAYGAIVPDFGFVQPLIGDLANIRYNAAHPIKWLGASPVTASEDFIYTGDGTIYPPSEYDEVHFWLVNYTDMVQSIDLLKWYGDGADPTSVTLQPWQVAYVTGEYDDILGAQWSIEGSEWYEKPAAGIPATDLASAVQTSLGKADTAVQSATIRTIVSLSQQDYDDLVDKDAATLYVIV